MQLIKQSTTAQALVFFMYDSSNHVTGKTGLSPTVVIRKEGGSFGSPSGSVTEIANGFYQVAGNATDTNTLGSLVLSATSAGADQATMGFQIVAFDPLSADNLGLGALPTAVPGASNGLLIAGVNDSATFTNAVVFGASLGITGSFSAASISSGNVNIGDLNIGGNLAVTSNFTVGGTITWTGAATFTGGLTGNITGNLSGSVGSVTGLTASRLDANVTSRMATFTLPTNFSSLAIDSSGRVTVGAYLSTLDFSATMKTSFATMQAANPVASVTGNIGGGVTGSVDSVRNDVAGNVNGSVGSVVDRTGFSLSATQTFSNTGTWTGNIVGTLSTLTTYTGNTPQTGDSFARIGATGSGLTSLSTSAQLVKVLAATYDSATLSGSTLTLSNGHTMVTGTTGRVTS